MKNYIGVKKLKASPMTLGEYNAYKGWSIPDNENPCDNGYLVKYEDGYKSWSPKLTFEKSYLEMNDTSRITEDLVKDFTGDYQVQKLDSKSTHVSTETKTGFITHGISSCVDPENYDQVIGAEIAAKKIKNKIWSHLGFVLQWANYGLKNV